MTSKSATFRGFVAADLGVSHSVAAALIAAVTKAMVKGARTGVLDLATFGTFTVPDAK